MVANAMALKPEVNKVTVIEINADVIALVAPSLHPKVEVIHADALTWEPPKGKKWEVIWHDIWPGITTDDLETRRLLSNRFARRWTIYHGAWAKDEIRRIQKGRY
jgi:16S rRNA A1518/A1519 N6-dimethyltransferase RsmA/KsgA/DIM1 with predicted DNA glycosylase/AP lyase activity